MQVIQPLQYLPTPATDDLGPNIFKASQVTKNETNVYKHPIFLSSVRSTDIDEKYNTAFLPFQCARRHQLCYENKNFSIWTTFGTS